MKLSTATTSVNQFENYLRNAFEEKNFDEVIMNNANEYCKLF